MKFVRNFLISLITIAVITGCMPKRLPEREEEEENVPLSQALVTALNRYRGVSSLRAQLFAKVEVREEFQLLRGVLLYERPAHLRLRLTTPIGGTVGEVIYSEGLISILLPTEGKMYRGLLKKEGPCTGDTLFLTMTFRDYQEIGGRSFPTRIYGEVEGKRIRFDLKLKKPQVNLPLPERAFIPATAGWEILPLADLKGLLSRLRGHEEL